MANKTKIIITHNESAADMQSLLATVDRNSETKQIANYMNEIGSGNRIAKLEVAKTAVSATGTFTMSTCVATNTLVINGVTFTCVASGATANQFNVGGTDTISATNAAAAINASVTALVAGYVTATSATTVVTITANDPGTMGNTMTLSATGGIAAGAARTAGGTEGTKDTYNFGL